MIEPKREVDILEKEKRKIVNNNGKSSKNSAKSITLPKIIRALIAIKDAKELEIRTIRDKKTKEVYLEVRFLKEGET